MGNSKFYISKESKDIIDSLKAILNTNDTPMVIKLALSKGIAALNGAEPLEKANSTDQWLVPENIIRGNEYLLFKHLIINEYNDVISDQDINKYFACLIERGTILLQKAEQEKTSFENIRVTLLN